MTRKRTLILVGALLLLIAVSIAYAFLQDPRSIDSYETTADSKTTSTTETHSLPTLDQLKHDQGNELEDLGEAQIASVFFESNNFAFVSVDSLEEPIEFAIEVTDSENRSFSIPDITYSPSDLMIGDTFGLAKLDKNYFAYHMD